MNLLHANQPHPLVKVFTGKVPFNDLISAAAVQAILLGECPERPIHPSCTDRLWTLTQQCWSQVPQDRPRMDQAIEELSVFSP